LPGGSTGSLHLNIHETSTAKIKVEYFPGLGSEGGEGGRGGAGGPGGIGSTIQWVTYIGCIPRGQCLRRLDTYQFPNGPQGDEGQRVKGLSGANGKIEKAEIFVANERVQ
jgi:hypothetical protein